ncbi:ABC transporter ATPase [Amylolactobacillus amylotrophicus DSM 20534]|nr:ABC transporter ATPase [Amylolactobacillus amylotrophicus DSM 20534]
MERLDPPKINKAATFSFPYTETVSRILLQTQDLVIGYDKALVEEAFNFSVGNGEKVAITGFNGIGKSTLLKTLLGELKPIYGGYDINRTTRIAYFKQDLKWDNGNMTPFQFMQQNFEDEKQKELRTVLARTGLTSQQAMSPLKTLSGGEQMKVKLAKLMLEPSNLLFLDEPTNHLDVATKDALRRAIIDYEGGVIVVSHEKDFFEGDWVDKIIDIEEMK